MCKTMKRNKILLRSNRRLSRSQLSRRRRFIALPVDMVTVVGGGTKNPVWMQIVADGQTTETTMSEGQTQDIQAAQSIQLNLGNAGVVKVTINGQDLGTLGTQGQVVRKEFKLEDYVTTGQ